MTHETHSPSHGLSMGETLGIQEIYLNTATLGCQPSKHLLSIGLPSIQALEQMDTALLLQTCLRRLLHRKGPRRDVAKIIYLQF